MVPNQLTRRDVLRLSGVALVGLSGCATQASDSDRRNSPSPTARERENAHRVDMPESINVRNPAGKPAVHSSAHSPEENMFESSASWDYEDWVVTSPSERDVLAFSEATNGVEAARDFIGATDLSETTLLVHQYNIGECDTRRLTRLRWGSDFSCGDIECVGISLNYEQTEREGGCQGIDSGESATPPYSKDSYANETTFIRIPAQIQSYGHFSVQV